MNNFAFEIEESPLLVFYDGGCSLCSREIRLLRRFDRNARIDWVDINHAKHLLEQVGLSYLSAMSRFHVFTRNGELVSGASAFLTLWSELPRLAWLSRLLSRFPGITTLEFVYVRFAKWRLARRLGQSCATGSNHDEQSMTPADSSELKLVDLKQCDSARHKIER